MRVQGVLGSNHLGFWGLGVRDYCSRFRDWGVGVGD